MYTYNHVSIWREPKAIKITEEKKITESYCFFYFIHVTFVQFCYFVISSILIQMKYIFSVSRYNLAELIFTDVRIFAYFY